MLETISLVGWFAFNLIFVLPLAAFIFYTLLLILPLLAATEDLDAPICENLELGQATDQNADGASPGNKNAGSEPCAVSYSIRTMVRLIYSIQKPLSLFRGLGFHLMWVAGLQLAVYAASLLPSIIGLVARILLPLVFIPVHVVWAHTTITFPSSKPFWRRLLPAGRMYAAVAPPMLITLALDALAKITMANAFKYIQGQSGTSSNPFETSPALMLLSCIVWVILVIPAHMMLARIETSLLPAEERPIISLSPAVSASQLERGYMSLKEAAKSLTWASITHLAILNLKIGAIGGTAVSVVQIVDLWWAATFWDMSKWKF